MQLFDPSKTHGVMARTSQVVGVKPLLTSVGRIIHQPRITGAVCRNTNPKRQRGESFVLRLIPVNPVRLLPLRSKRTVFSQIAYRGEAVSHLLPGSRYSIIIGVSTLPDRRHLTAARYFHTEKSAACAEKQSTPFTYFLAVKSGEVRQGGKSCQTGLVRCGCW